MIDLYLLDDARRNFEMNFKAEGEVMVNTQMLNGDEVIVVENLTKRAFYSFERGVVKLKNVINLRGENE